MNNEITLQNEQSMIVSSLTLDKDELHGFCRLLQARARAAGELEVANYHKGDLTDDQYEINLKNLSPGANV